MNIKYIYAAFFCFFLTEVLVAAALPPLGQRLYLIDSSPEIPATIVEENQNTRRIAERGAFLKDPGFPTANNEDNQTSKKDRTQFTQKTKIKAVQKKQGIRVNPNPIITGESYFTAKAKFPRRQLQPERVVSDIKDAPILIDYGEKTRDSELQLLKTD